jgi:hypothetical protein
MSEFSGTPSLEVVSASFRGDANRVKALVNVGSGVAGADEDSAGEQPSDDYCSKTYFGQKELDVSTRHQKSIFTCLPNDSII